jgi:hypothetical protein
METNQYVTIDTIVPHIHKKKSKLTVALYYDKMLSVSYTLENGELNKEKIIQQSYSFTKNN